MTTTSLRHLDSLSGAPCPCPRSVSHYYPHQSTASADASPGFSVNFSRLLASSMHVRLGWMAATTFLHFLLSGRPLHIFVIPQRFPMRFFCFASAGGHHGHDCTFTFWNFGVTCTGHSNGHQELTEYPIMYHYTLALIHTSKIDYRT